MSELLRVGVVGVGVMGADHAARLANRISGASLVAVSDPDGARAEAVASSYPGVQVIDSPLALVAADFVDAVLIASPGAAHEEQVLACLAAGKYVLCEKPLTVSSESALRLVTAERAGGRPLVQVGFMRRYDPAYTRLKSGLGRVLVLHNIHRNKTAPGSFGTEMIVRDSLVHEVDVSRWLFDDEIATISVLTPAPSALAPPGVSDPLVAIFRMTGGGIATNEVFVNSQLGYEVRCEAVGEQGSRFVDAALPLPDNFLSRFEAAYDLEVQSWVDACRRGEVTGPTTWDGYAATAVCEAGVRSLHDGGSPVAVALVR
ncbi:myo-inositol 2-dehydrogenase [Asanoa ferruginea]|uniref:Myo-inositol 2-dehydrogenase n=1 Tax=Asanoa ferruginea TaxID=53367 RepID=A0A3D9ZRZ9_9ACTN|nr:Gfo/Idh/MocA family oxidoreductase [Asanoa ferruginea]REF99242.1 myo-inositol 2-dehydrogenase [Asanoa ferruginea]GIF45839.1 inositol 2-dehydrogenase [Asanoa ferruginea]